MTDKIKTIILLLAINSMICEEQDSDQPMGFAVCGNSKDETISLAGAVHYEVSNLFPLKTRDSEQLEEITQLLWDIYTESFFEIDTMVRVGYKAQGGFYIPESAESGTKSEIDRYQKIFGNITERLSNKTHSDITNPLSVNFFYKKESKEWKKMVSLNGVEIELKGENMTDVDIWPDQWVQQTPDLGAGAFWKTQQTFVYIINGADNSKNAFIFTRTLEDIDKKISWTSKEIPNTAGRVFTSAFNWLFTEKILAQVIERGKPRSTAQIYEYKPNDPKIFVFKAKSSRDLWDCKEEDIENNEILVFILMVITILVLAITVCIVFYFVFFIIIRKVKDPIFGFSQQRKQRK